MGGMDSGVARDINWDSETIYKSKGSGREERL